MPLVGEKTVIDFALQNAVKLKELIQFDLHSCTLALLVPESQKEQFRKYANKYMTWLIGGDEENVLSRFEKYQFEGCFDYIIRLTADCPVFNPFLAHEMFFKTTKGAFDYGHIDTTTDYPDGLDAEVISAELLVKLVKSAEKKEFAKNKEHVTFHVKNAPLIPAVIYRHHKVQNTFKYPKLSVDTKLDLERVKKIIKEIPWICSQDKKK